MALNITKIDRDFILKKGDKEVHLKDPNPELTPEEVMKFYAGQHPELTNATLAGPKVEGGKAVYTAKTVVGTKG